MSVPYFLFTYIYVKVCIADVLCTDGYIHFMKCTDIIELCTYTDVFFWFQLFVLPQPVPEAYRKNCVKCKMKYSEITVVGCTLER